MKTLVALIGTMLIAGAACADPPTTPKIEQTTKASATVAASIGKAGDAAGPVEADTAKEGARPGGTARSTTRIPVTIVSVDTQTESVAISVDPAT